MQAVDQIFLIIILIMSVVVHEVAHGYTAYLLGDDTAKYEGRLTLNPIKHLDLFGSIIVPLILVITHAGFILGWAKPVPFNPANLRNGKKGIILVSIAGILANIFLAIIFGIIMRLGPSLGILDSSPFYNIAGGIVLINLVLALFNLIPIPPLDGSKILFELLPYRFKHIQTFFEKWGLVLLLFFIIFLWDLVFPVVLFLFNFLTGLG